MIVLFVEKLMSNIKFKVINNKTGFEYYFEDYAFESAFQQVQKVLKKNGFENYTVWRRNSSPYLFRDKNGNTNQWILFRYTWD